MHMGVLANIAASSPSNFKHIVFNNGTHDSVGGQPTVAANRDQFLSVKSLKVVDTNM